MNFGEHVFLYCERGTNEALLAEPVNAASNSGQPHQRIQPFKDRTPKSVTSPSNTMGSSGL